MSLINNSKNGVVLFGESKHVHALIMKGRSWVLGNDSVDEYKNLCVFKNYYGSFETNVEENIEKTRKKAGVERQVPWYIFSAGNQPVYHL